MDFFETIEKRRSNRKFTKKKIPIEVLDKAIDAGLLAPNSSNLQLWEFYCVTSDEFKKKLGEACLSQPAATTANALIVAVARRDKWKTHQRMILKDFEQKQVDDKKIMYYYKTLIPFVYAHGPLSVLGFFKRLMVNVTGISKPMPRTPFSHTQSDVVAIKSTALACQNIMNALTAQGYDSCPMEGFDEKRVQKILGLPSAARVTMIIGCGKGDPEGIYGERVRFERSNFVKHL